MTRFLTLFSVFALSLGTAQAAQTNKEPKIGPVLEHITADYVQPAYSAFNQVSKGLDGAFSTLCADPSKVNLDATRQAFRNVADSWSRIEWFRLGPVMSDDRLERVLFFPDRKGTGRKQVQAALASKDESVTDVSKLKNKSVAMQGLGALEYILFGKGSETLLSAPKNQRCEFGQAASTNLVNISNELVAGWAKGSPFPKMFLNPGVRNPYFRDNHEALSVVLGQIIHGAEAIHDMRIGAFLNQKEADQDRPKSALFWRSNMTMPTIIAGLEGLEAMFNKSSIETVAAQKDPKIGPQMRFEFEQAIKTAKSLNEPVADLLADPAKRKKLVYLDYAVKIIIDRLDKEFAQASGLEVGFSFGDGD